MFRAAVLSLALTVVVGQNTAPLCWAWCDPQPAAETECHHHDTVATSVSMVGDVTCDMVVFSGVGFLREEPRQSASPQHARHAILVPRYELASLTTDDRPGPEPGSEWSPGNRTLPTVLRL